MEEIQERLEGVKTTQGHLNAIRRRAQEELKVLELTDKIENAKTELAALKESQRSSQQRGEGERKTVASLEWFVEEASEQAGKSITHGLES